MPRGPLRIIVRLLLSLFRQPIDIFDRQGDRRVIRRQFGFDVRLNLNGINLRTLCINLIMIRHVRHDDN